jgi:hypothetical protein
MFRKRESRAPAKAELNRTESKVNNSEHHEKEKAALIFNLSSAPLSRAVACQQGQALQVI